MHHNKNSYSTNHSRQDENQYRAEQTIMMLLLGEEQPAPWSREELAREVRQSAHVVTDALNHLHGIGLIHFDGQLAFPTRAARYMDELRIELDEPQPALS